jgi:hypothetical protein
MQILLGGERTWDSRGISMVVNVELRDLGSLTTSRVVALA